MLIAKTAAPNRHACLFAGCFVILCGYFVNITAQAKDTQAVASLSFSKDISTSYQSDLEEYYKDQSRPFSRPVYANYDLNGDNLDEIIIKDENCTITGTCLFQILAYRQNKIIAIGQIYAREIMIGGSTTYGVTDILAFDDKINDYNFSIYMWSPQEKTYILNKE